MKLIPHTLYTIKASMTKGDMKDTQWKFNYYTGDNEGWFYNDGDNRIMKLYFINEDVYETRTN